MTWYSTRNTCSRPGLTQRERDERATARNDLRNAGHCRITASRDVTGLRRGTLGELAAREMRGQQIANRSRELLLRLHTAAPAMWFFV
jgi:hypothetical protein